MISPNFPDEKLDNLSLEDLVDVFEVVKSRVIEPACVLLAMPRFHDAVTAAATII
jgi:hypothetical protein